ncbi:histidine phosphatase superfamily [Lentinula edodes]|uniref:histidine phosphatase superfamily n=1 Tax=Lentinula edodes TaxID=5353 RepID=UPI001E8EBA6C|nr:histidine phosphatase superfamily [Lentinula edodes]KAH7877995.1 histidine phosphatase superfamily [Lentinula edodes]KAJ3921141.1 phosphoglycerate mutase [Lentinula edodes]
MVTFTFIRHGQSTDNVKRVWAGWKDAPLSNHGMKQATALGKWFSDKGIHFTAILSSTLDRAATTAEVILSHQPGPHPPHIKSLLLREQHFGSAEGKSWSRKSYSGATLEEENRSQGTSTNHSRRSDRFPGGESRKDLAARAERVIDELLLPYILNTTGPVPSHVAVVSHGLFIREIVDALYRREFGGEGMQNNHRGLSNTGWTKVIVNVKRSIIPTSPPSVSKLDLSVRITAINEHEHLDNLVRQKGGIGSLAHDPKQKDIRGFFAGSTGASSSSKS